MKKAIIICSLILLLPTACGVLGDNTKITLWSQTADILPFVDRYNALQDKFKIEVRSVQAPADEFIISETVPDLLLSENLSSPSVATRLDVLNDLLNQGGINPRLFYPGLLSRYLYNNNTIALPFSFHLPLIVAPKDFFKDDPPGTISLESIRNQSADLNRYAGDKPVALGFSPFFDPNFIFTAAALYGAGFHSDANVKLAWDDENLFEFMAWFSDWCKKNAGSSERELAFIRHYLYEPPYHILKYSHNECRLGCYATTEQNFFTLASDKTGGLDFAWITKNGKIAANDDILSFGIPRGTGNRAGAIDFLKWVFTEQVQSAIMEENRKQTRPSFGIAGGFSSVQTINEQKLPAIYPVLVGRIPDGDTVLFPGPLPIDWKKLKNEVILPWITRSVDGTETPGPLLEEISK